MANQEQLDILKQGVDVWNGWRIKNLPVEIDLEEANLRNANLGRCNLTGADLSGADLGESDLRVANLRDTKFRNTDLSGSDLRNADLIGADLSGANLCGAVLCEANLNKAKLNLAYLRDADFGKSNLGESDLRDADLGRVYLRGANLRSAIVGDTSLRETDLSDVLGIEEVHHEYPSSIDTGTLRLSKGKIPESFLRGCGLSDWEIESAKLYNPDLANEEIVKIQYRMFDLRATQALQISPLFISYSHADTAFVDRLDTSLIQKGVRFWRDIHDATAGRLETQIDRAIRQNPTVLLVLSKNSIKSDWVEHEVRKARELEKELGRDALCPVALDDGWKSSPWPERVMEQIMEYNILDFSGWQDKSTFDSKFAKLLSGLDLFYKKPTA